jgi:hypothetical protein
MINPGFEKDCLMKKWNRKMSMNQLPLDNLTRVKNKEKRQIKRDSEMYINI